MPEETIKITFAVVCGSQNCGTEFRWEKFRILSATDPDPAVQLDIDEAREAFLNGIKRRDNRLVELAHYRYKGGYRDVFIGIANIPASGVLEMRNGFLQIVETDSSDDTQGRGYLNAMFRSFFKDLVEESIAEDPMSFEWLEWVMVPLKEALEGRFNPIGMGGEGSP